MTAPALKVHVLTRRAFAPFGDVIETRGAQSMLINDGSTRRYHDLARIDVSASTGHALLNIFRAQPLKLPFEVRTLERHPLGSQAFVPLERRPFLIVVAENAAGDKPGRVHAFISRDGQGVNYHRGVWHHPLMALTRVSDFVVIDRGGSGRNCETIVLDASWRLAAIPARSRRKG